jgi:hypothetical protein
MLNHQEGMLVVGYRLSSKTNVFIAQGVGGA